MRVNTSLLHGYPVLDVQIGAASIPKYQTSTFAQQKLVVSKSIVTRVLAIRLYMR